MGEHAVGRRRTVALLGALVLGGWFYAEPGPVLAYPSDGPIYRDFDDRYDRYGGGYGIRPYRRGWAYDPYWRPYRYDPWAYGYSRRRPVHRDPCVRTKRGAPVIRELGWYHHRTERVC